MYPELAAPAFWSSNLGLDKVPQHSFGAYIMGYEGKSLYRAGALGINKRASSATDKKTRTILNRIAEVRGGRLKSIGRTELYFFAGLDLEWLPYLERVEIYLQGEIYRNFLYVGTSHF